jgi:MerR family transcriptional regulator, light-induced transcriptional regulator
MATLEKQLGEAIYSQMNQLADRMVASQQSQRVDISPQYGLNDRKYREYGQHDLYQLAEAMIANNPPQFARYILWQRSMLRGHKVPDFFVELQLQAEQTALTGALAAEYHLVILRFLQAAVQALHAPESSAQSFIPAPPFRELVEQYLKTLLAGDRAEASEIITRAVDAQISIRDIYLNVFKPSLYEVGRLWQTGQITVAHEHFFSAATQLIMSELYPRIHQHAVKNGNVVVAACVSGELHEIGLRMAADLLELEGWQTYYLGANTPAMSIVDIMREKKARLLMLSMCLPINGPELRALIAMVRQQLGGEVKIIIGGYSISSDPVYAASFGADAVAVDAGDAPEIAARLLGR